MFRIPSMEQTLKNIITRTPLENLSIAKFMIIDYLNRGEIDYKVYLGLELMIETKN